MSKRQRPINSLFEDKAHTILIFLKQSLRYNHQFLPRPFFLEFTGSPSSGKTTTITEFDKFFRHMGFRVLRPQEGAEVIRHIERDTPLYNIRTGLYALQMLIDISAGHQYDLVIFDRGIFDAYSWMLYWQEKKLLSVEEATLIQQFFLSRFWADKIDVAYFMTCDVDTAIERELRIALSDKLGKTTSPDTVRRLIERYRKAFEVLSPNHPQLFLIDTTSMSEQKMVEKIATQTLVSLEEKVKLQQSA